MKSLGTFITLDRVENAIWIGVMPQEYWTLWSLIGQRRLEAK